MPKYTTTDLRNLAITGHAGSGKTTLVEHLLHAAGVIGKVGKVEEGTTVCDYEDLEKEYKHSLDSALVHFDYTCSSGEMAHINLIDTPGTPDFIGKSIACFPAVDTVVVVIDAGKGIEMVTRRMMKVADERNIPQLIVINKIDHSDKLDEVLAALQETFGDVCRCINLPANGGKSVIDCYQNTTGESDLGPVSEFHTAIIDQVVEVDEELMAHYLEHQTVPMEKLHDPFEKALREHHLVPVCFTNARDGVGIKELLDIMVKLCPNPREGNPRPFEFERNGQMFPFSATGDPNMPLLAHVFKVASDPYVGKLSVFRVHQGTLTNDAHPKVDDGKKAVRIAHLFKLQGKTHHEVDKLVAGDIGAVAKIDEIHWGSVLHNGDIGEHMHLKPLPIPKPMFGLAIEGTNKNADAKLSEALAKMIAEDPTFHMERVSATHEQVIRGLGEMHLRLKLRLLKDRYGVEVTSKPPKVAYKETISAKAEGHHRHKKQTGGAGQFGEVFLRVEPLENGTGGEAFEFVDDTFGGSVPRQFLPAIEKGVRQVMSMGAVAGYPMQGIRVSVYDGKHHPVDSKEVAFITAGKRAFIDAVQKARPVLLEPWVTLEITVPADSIGDISGDLSGKRGRIIGTDMLPGNQAVVKAEAPLSEVMNYANQLKSITAGLGSFSMDYSHDEHTPPQVQAQVVAAYKPHVEED